MNTRPTRYKHIVKHKRSVNRVFSELGAEITLRPRPPGVDKKTLAPGAPGSSVAAVPSKRRRKRGSQKDKSKAQTENVSSTAMCPSKTKSLVSSKRKR
jgi:hypothetical protein